MNFARPHRALMPLAVEQNESPGPRPVRSLGPHRLVMKPHHFAELLAQAQREVWEEEGSRSATRLLVPYFRRPSRLIPLPIPVSGPAGKGMGRGFG
jgi:hypothetical protein